MLSTNSKFQLFECDSICFSVPHVLTELNKEHQEHKCYMTKHYNEEVGQGGQTVVSDHM